MRRLLFIPCLVVASGIASLAQPIPALKFEGLWVLDGPDAVKPKLEFQVNGDDISATYHHPFPSVLSDIRIEGDRFTAWYLDDFGSRVGLTAQLKGSELQLAVAPVGRPPLIYSGARTAPEPSRGTHQRFSGSVNKTPISGSFNKTPKGASGEFTAGDHSFVFSAGIDGPCVNVSAGKDGKGASINGCVSVQR